MMVGLLIAYGCSAKRQAGWKIEIEKGTGNVQVLLEKADALWEQRAEQAKLEEAIKAYEEVIAVDPNNLEVLTKLSRAYYLLADGYLEGGDVERQLETYNKGAQYGEMAMALDPEFKKRVESGAKIEDAISVLDNKYIGAIYWSASNLGKWAKKKGFLTLLKYKDKARKMVQKVLEMDEKYFYGAPHRYFGAYYALAPAFAGGDLKKSEEHFNKSLEIAPDYIGTWVLKADTLDVKLQDKELYRKDLEKALEIPAESIPEILPEQNAEKRKARLFLDDIDSRFIEKK
jgi:tetratricopeptide (TPR) repeat protein